jgi:hypothetical protein
MADKLYKAKGTRMYGSKAGHTYKIVRGYRGKGPEDNMWAKLKKAWRKMMRRKRTAKLLNERMSD